MKYARLLLCISMILLATNSIALFGQSAQAKKRPTVALVLEGGSAYGFAHIGVIKVIEEMGIQEGDTVRIYEMEFEYKK